MKSVSKVAPALRLRPTDANCIHSAPKCVCRLLPRQVISQTRVAGRYVAHADEYEAPDVVDFAIDVCPTLVALVDRIYNCGCA